MRIIANNYKPNEVFKIIREWTELTQEELAKELNYKTYHSIKQIERGINSFTFQNLMKIALNFSAILIYSSQQYQLFLN